MNNKQLKLSESGISRLLKGLLQKDNPNDSFFKGRKPSDAKWQATIEKINVDKLCKDSDLDNATLSNIIKRKSNVNWNSINTLFKWLEMSLIEQDLVQLPSENNQEKGAARGDCATNISPAINTIIDDRLSSGFVGRKFVFDAFSEFRNKYPNGGYFTIIAEPGMGKSTIAAQYVKRQSVTDDVDCACFFVNYRGENNAESCILEICNQINDLYDLKEEISKTLVSNAISRMLSNILRKASDSRTRKKQLVIVIDALDELEASNSSQNICFLPDSLPKDIYFLLTRRPFEDSEEKLFVSPNCNKQKFQLWEENYMEQCNSDIKEYIENQLASADYASGLKDWIQKRDITEQRFVEILTERSKGNFMYIRYVIPAIATPNGIYTDVNFSGIPDTLRGHYRNHVDRMYRLDLIKNITKTEKKSIIAVFLQSRKIEISINYIATLLNLDVDGVVAPIVIHCVPFFDPRNFKDFNLSRRDRDARYQFYHKDFIDFLRDEEIDKKIQSDINRKIEDQSNNDFDLDSIFELNM